MTRVINGRAQPDIVAEKDGRTLLVFVETASSLQKNLPCIFKTLSELSLIEIARLDKVEIVIADEIKQRIERGDMSKFHAKDGWFFERLTDGAVKITTEAFCDITLDADTWASAVASVSAAGDMAETFKLAVNLHMGAV